MTADAPALPAYRSQRPGRTPQYAVWCVHCRAWRYHSAEDGHRAAHCAEDSPYSATGYELRWTGEDLTPAIKREHSGRH